MITWENYEEYMMLHADGELTRAEEQELMSFVYEHPELANELAAFSMSKMIPDTTQMYAAKKSLLKKEPVRVVAFPHWQRYAVAAGVVILLSVAGVRFFTSQPAHTSDGYVQNDKKEMDEAAVVAVNGGSFTAQPAHVASGSVQDDEKERDEAPVVAVNGGSFTAQPTHRASSSVQDDKKVGVPTHRDSHRDYSAVRDDKKVIAPSAVAVEAIDRLPAEYVGMINNDRKIFSPGAVTNMPTATIYIEEEQKRSFLDKLPIDELKKGGLENVATAVATGYDKVNAIRQGISEASITVRVEKRKLILSF